MVKLELFTKGEDNAKLDKSSETVYSVIGLFLSPHTANDRGVNLCPFASDACVSACLNTSGRARVMPELILGARRRKANEFLANRSQFIERLKSEIVVYERRATKNGKKLAVRLNGTSDIDFPSSLFEQFPSVQFWDYTKSPHRMSKFLCGNLPSNYHLTFSYSGENLTECQTVLAAGGNVTVVFSSKDFPATFLGYPVISGDSSDLRFLDPSARVVGLKAKGKAKVEASSFVIQIDKR